MSSALFMVFLARFGPSYRFEPRLRRFAGLRAVYPV
jgi:hypothetical protein